MAALTPVAQAQKGREQWCQLFERFIQMKFLLCLILCLMAACRNPSTPMIQDNNRIVQFQGLDWEVIGEHDQFGSTILHLQRGAMYQNVSATSVQ
jgi:hypothetical protein